MGILAVENMLPKNEQHFPFSVAAGDDRFERAISLHSESFENSSFAGPI